MGTGALILTNNNNNNLSRWRIDSGTIRADSGGELGVSTNPQAIIPNGSFLEIRTDVGNTFSNVLFTFNNNAQGLFLDRAVADLGSLNQTAQFNAMASVNNVTALVGSRDGFNMIVSTFTVPNAANGSAFNWQGNGLVTIGTFTNTGGTTANQGDTFNTTGDGLIPLTAINITASDTFFSKMLPAC